MLMPFEWVVGDSSKDHTVTASMFYDVLATVRYTTLRGITTQAPQMGEVQTLDKSNHSLSGLSLSLLFRFSRPVQRVHLLLRVAE